MLGPPVKRPLKKLCFGGSGISLVWNSMPDILAIVSLESEEMVNFEISDGDDKYSPWPLVLNVKVRAILSIKTTDHYGKH